MRVVASAAVAAIALSACGGSTTVEAIPHVDVYSLDQATTVDLASIDTPAVLNVWASNCAPCVREMPTLQGVANERPDVAFFGVSVAESQDNVVEFLDQVDVDYPQFVDEGGFVSEALGVDAMPTTFFVDTDGSIVKRHRGEITADQLRAALDEYL